MLIQFVSKKYHEVQSSAEGPEKLQKTSFDTILRNECCLRAERASDAAFLNHLRRGCFAFGPELLRPNPDVFTKGADMILRDQEGALLSHVLLQGWTPSSSSSFTCLLQRRAVRHKGLLQYQERYSEAVLLEYKERYSEAVLLEYEERYSEAVLLKYEERYSEAFFYSSTRNVTRKRFYSSMRSVTLKRFYSSASGK